MKISEINIYPIKSLKGISLDSSLIERRGLRYDRRWMLTKKDGVFMTQREFPRMALVGVAIGARGIEVSLDGRNLTVPFEPEKGSRQTFDVWGRPGEGVVYDEEVNRWFSDAIGVECQLVYMPDDSSRHVSPLFDRGEDIVSFADGYPLLVIGETSLDDLNSRLERPLPMNRFRPNIVVTDSGAFAEDDWKKISVGDSVFISTKPCERCVLTTVDQTKGEFDGKEPLKTLASYRMAKDVMPNRFASLGVSATAVLFGQNLIAESPGTTIRLGDSVTVVE